MRNGFSGFSSRTPDLHQTWGPALSPQGVLAKFLCPLRVLEGVSMLTLLSNMTTMKLLFQLWGQ